jgi:hypothetical protein
MTSDGCRINAARIGRAKSIHSKDKPTRRDRRMRLLAIDTEALKIRIGGSKGQGSCE